MFENGAKQKEIILASSQKNIVERKNVMNKRQAMAGQ